MDAMATVIAINNLSKDASVAAAARGAARDAGRHSRNREWIAWRCVLPVGSAASASTSSIARRCSRGLEHLARAVRVVVLVVLGHLELHHADAGLQLHGLGPCAVGADVETPDVLTELN